MTPISVVVGPALLADGTPVLTLLQACMWHRPDVVRYLQAFTDDVLVSPISALPDIVAALEDDYLDAGEEFWTAAAVPA